MQTTIDYSIILYEVEVDLALRWTDIQRQTARESERERARERERERRTGERQPSYECQRDGCRP